MVRCVALPGRLSSVKFFGLRDVQIFFSLCGLFSGLAASITDWLTCIVTCSSKYL